MNGHGPMQNGGQGAPGTEPHQVNAEPVIGYEVQAGTIPHPLTPAVQHPAVVLVMQGPNGLYPARILTCSREHLVMFKQAVADAVDQALALADQANGAVPIAREVPPLPPDEMG